MQYTEILVRYGELSTKGKNQKVFIKRLQSNTRKALAQFEKLTISANRDRMHIKLNGESAEAVMEIVDKIFGIQNYSPAIKVSREIEVVRETALAMVKTNYQPGDSFKVNTRRTDHSYYLDTNELNQDLGGYIFENIPGIQVKMKNPTTTVRVEVHEDGFYLSSETIKGSGGLPVGTSGKAMLMLSGGIDSPVAGYLTMKRGVEIEMVHFFSPPYTSQKALDKAKELTAKLTPYTGSIKFIEVPFTEIQEEIKAKVPSGYLMTVTRRLMMRLTEAILRQRRGKAIVNGESLGQVASQTLDSMIAINDVTCLPVIRPVVSMDKNEIIEIAEKIDTFKLSIQPFEDCCTIFAPPAPKTRPNLEKTRQYEKLIDVEGLMERSLAGLKITEIQAGDQFLNATEEIFEDLL